jgi:ketosteroid isomerase-like protein
MKRAILGAVVLGVALGGYLYWTSDERRIRRLLDGVAEAVSQERESVGMTDLLEVAGLSRYLAPDVVLEPGEPFPPITGASEVVSTVGRLRATMATMRLEISDVQVAIDGHLASVNAGVRLTLRNVAGDERIEARRAVVALEKRDAGWLITMARGERVRRPER